MNNCCRFLSMVGRSSIHSICLSPCTLLLHEICSAVPGDDELTDICLQAASAICTQDSSSWKGVKCPSFGLFSSHIEASIDLEMRIKGIEVKDSVSAEKKAAMYIWQGNVEAAMDILSDADCLGTHCLWVAPDNHFVHQIWFSLTETCTTWQLK